MLVLHYVYFAIEDRYGEAPPPFPRPVKRKTHVINSQIKRYVAKLLMYISFTFHFRYILTEVAITTKPFEAHTAKFGDVQVEVLKLLYKASRGLLSWLVIIIGNFIHCA